MNNSKTGGYLLPLGKPQLPNELTLDQFLQTMLVGITGFDKTLVRPLWQVAPPKQPDLTVNWLAFGVTQSQPNANAYVWQDPSGNTFSTRHAKLEIQCSFYGPDAFDNADELRDGFQLQQNLAALQLANMGYTEITEARHIPDLVNERFINRVVVNVYLQREIQRYYPILSFVSAHGTIYAQNTGGVNQDASFDSGS